MPDVVGAGAEQADACVPRVPCRQQNWRPAGCRRRSSDADVVAAGVGKSDVVVAGVGKALVEIAGVAEADVVLPRFAKPML